MKEQINWVNADETIIEQIRLKEQKITNGKTIIACLLVALFVFLFFCAIDEGNPDDKQTLLDQKARIEQRLESLQQEKLVKDRYPQIGFDFLFGLETDSGELEESMREYLEEYRKEHQNQYVVTGSESIDSRIEQAESELEEVEQKIEKLEKKNQQAFLTIFLQFLGCYALCLLPVFGYRWFYLKKVGEKQEFLIRYGTCIGKDRYHSRFYYAHYLVIQYEDGTSEKNKVPGVCFDDVTFNDDIFVVSSDAELGYYSRIYKVPEHIS